MAAVRMCVRSVLRHRLWGAVAVTILVGVAGGAVLAAYAGARRTDSAFPRLLDRTRVFDELILPRQYEDVRAAAIAKLPGVEQVGSAQGFGFGSRPGNDGFPTTGAGALASDGTIFYDLERFVIADGRLPRPGRADEVLVSETAAKSLGVRVGSRVHALVFNFTTYSNAAPGADPATIFKPADVRVVGVGRSIDEIISNENVDAATVMLTPAFARKFPDLVNYAAFGVRLRDPERDVPRFERALARRYPDVQFELRSRMSREATFGRTVQPYSDALRFFALVAALTALLVVGQALARLVVSDASDGAELEAIGATRAQRAATAGGRALGVVIVGAALAAVVGVAASPLFPLGPARTAEPDPGLRVDDLVVVAGFFAIAALLGASVAIGAWRLARSSGLRTGAGAPPWRPSRVAERLGRMGAPASALNGVRFAVQRDRRTDGGSLAATLVGLVVAVATIGAALTFGTNLDRLVTTPARYGWNWDALIDTYDSGASPALIKKLERDGDISGLTVGFRGTNIRLQGDVYTAFGFERLRGSVVPQATEGRFPRARDEVALGAQTLRDLGRSVGDTIAATAANGTPIRLRIVGRTVLPSLSLSGTEGLGDGVALTKAGLRRLDPGADPSFFIADLAPGATTAEVNRRYRDTASALGPQRPGDIQAYVGVRSTPLVLAGLLALLGIGVLAHLLITSVRARRRDLAVLKTLGSSRRQVGATVAWQATTIAGLALVIGIPIGIIAGRWTWRGFADDLGVVATVAVPGLAFLAIAVVGLVLANLIAAFPARTAARTRAAVVLRSE
jgi:ABC-type lipoprotein release transport system permease subunit